MVLMAIGFGMGEYGQGLNGVTGQQPAQSANGCGTARYVPILEAEEMHIICGHAKGDGAGHGFSAAAWGCVRIAVIGGDNDMDGIASVDELRAGAARADLQIIGMRHNEQKMFRHPTPRRSTHTAFDWPRQ
jgi:hypothetical protein